MDPGELPRSVTPEQAIRLVSSGGSWASSLAAALVVHAPLPETCAENVAEVFCGVTELWCGAGRVMNAQEPRKG